MNLSAYSKISHMNWSIISISRDPIWYAIGFVLALFCGYKAFFADIATSKELIKTLTIMSGTLLGFLVTSFSILFAISDRDFIVTLRSERKIDNLTSQVSLTSSILIVALLFSVIYLINNNQFLVSVISGLVVFSLVMFARVAYKYKQLFKFL